MKLTNKRLLGVLALAGMASVLLATSAGQAGEKVELCHWSKGDAAYYRIEVSVGASAMHLARHGDYLYDGTCDYEPDPT